MNTCGYEHKGECEDTRKAEIVIIDDDGYVVDVMRTSMTCEEMLQKLVSLHPTRAVGTWNVGEWRKGDKYDD